MLLPSKLRKALFIFCGAIALSCTAEVTLEGDFSFKTTLKKDRIEFDTTISFSLSGEAFEFTSTWKADEKGFSSLKFVGEAEFPHDIDGRAEIMFDEERVKSLKLKGYDLLFFEALLDIEAYFKHKEGFYIYQMSLDLDELTLASLPCSLDLVFREEYLRAKLSLHREDDGLSLQGIWKQGTLYEVKATFDHNGDNWSVKETLTFKSTTSPLHPEKGTLTVDGEVLDDLSLKVACYHTFPKGGIEVTKLIPTVKLEMGEFDLTWKGTFRPVGAAFLLGDYDFTLAAAAQIGDLSLDTVLKLDEDGFSSFSVKLSL